MVLPVMLLLVSCASTAYVGEPFLPGAGHRDILKQVSDWRENIKDSPWKGEERRPITLIVFGDYECPYSRKFYFEKLPQLQAAFPGQLNVIAKHLPLPFHSQAVGAARAAVAAGLQGKFWEMHQRLYAEQGNFSDSSHFVLVATSLDLDPAKFIADIDSPSVKGLVDRELKLGKNWSIHSVPTIVLNGSLIPGNHSLKYFESIIQFELSQSHYPSPQITFAKLPYIESVKAFDTAKPEKSTSSQDEFASSPHPGLPSQKEKAKVKALPVIAFGTGWALESGLIVTNYHVIKEAKSISLISVNGEETVGKLINIDQSNDLALIKPESTSIVRYGLRLSNELVRVGSSVFTLGFPHPNLLGVEPKLTNGVVSSTKGIGGDPRFYQITVPLQAGNSGGPLINNRGEVVGIVTGKLNALKVLEFTGDLTESVNYAVKASYLKGMLQDARGENAPTLALHPSASKSESLEDLSEVVVDSVVMIAASSR